MQLQLLQHRKGRNLVDRHLFSIVFGIVLMIILFRIFSSSVIPIDLGVNLP